MKSVLIIAGENSGEKYGADVVREFKKRCPGISLFGIGGQRMQEEGVELVFGIEDLSAVGIFEVLVRIPHFRGIFRRLEQEIDARKPSAAVLIDSPDFNLRLAKKLKKAGIPVLYYISPTVWAWRSGRLKTIQDVVTRMLLIFPFETRIYSERNIPAVFVGHPLTGKITLRLSRDEFLFKYALSRDTKLVTLLPGSRRTEIKNHLPVLLAAVQKMKAEFAVQFVLVLAESLRRDDLDRFLTSSNEEIKVLTGVGYEAIAYSDLVLSSCGTANLEAALLGTPLVAYYHLSPLTYYPFRHFLKIQNYSIVNILAGRPIVPELIQRGFRSAALAAEAKSLLFDEVRRATMKSEFRRIVQTLGQERAAENVARELERILGDSST